LTKEFPTDGTLAQRVVVDSVGTPFAAQSLVADNAERIIAAMDGIRVVTARSSYRLNSEGSISTLEGFRMTIPELIRTVATRADRPIIDDTGSRRTVLTHTEGERIVGRGLKDKADAELLRQRFRLEDEP
jgi:hypothetical protein